MTEKKSPKPAKKIIAEDLGVEELDDAHGGAILDTTRINISTKFNTAFGGLNFDTVYGGGIDGLSDLPIRRK